MTNMHAANPADEFAPSISPGKKAKLARELATEFANELTNSQLDAIPNGDGAGVYRDTAEAVLSEMTLYFERKANSFDPGRKGRLVVSMPESDAERILASYDAMRDGTADLSKAMRLLSELIGCMRSETTEHQPAYANYCPVCGSADIEGDGIDINNMYCHQPCVCRACGATWTDTYMLVASEVSGKGGL